MDACVFVDGENFRFSIVELFKGEFRPQDYLPSTAKWSEFFEYVRIQSNADFLLRTYWYVVDRIDAWPYGLLKLPDEKLFKILSKDGETAGKLNAESNIVKKSELAKKIATQLEQEKDRMQSRFEGWRTVQDSIASNQDSLEFRRAGAIAYNCFTGKLLKEKAVDVKLSVDLLELKDAYKMAIIVSGDQDYVPAVQALKDYGKIVVNVAFSRKDGSLLPGGARRLNIMTDKRITIPYEKCKELLLGGPPVALKSLLPTKKSGDGAQAPASV